MHNNHQLVATEIAGLLLALLTISGCACSCPRCAPITSPGWQPGCGVPNPCYGYFSTCWRGWSPQCAPCPSFAATSVAPLERVLPAEPLPGLPGSHEQLGPEVPAPRTETPSSGFIPSGLNWRDQPAEAAHFVIPTPAAPQTPISLRPARLDSR